MTHTPGPWTVNGHQLRSRWYGDITHNWEESGKNFTRTVAAVCKNATSDENEANARLIAAAPRLLQALQEALPHIDSIAIISKCQAAINEATKGTTK